MKLNLLIFGGSSALVVVCLVLAHALIQAHLFTVMVGWAIFMVGAALGLALALVMIYFEIIVDSFKYNPGMGYGDFQEGDYIAKTSAKDLISAPKEKELNIFIPEDYLCSNAISARKGSKLSDYAEVISLGMVSGYNTFDFMMETEFGYYETSEEFLNSLSDFCRQNQNERFSLAIIKIINLSE